MAALQEVALVAVNDMNVGGVLLEDHLWAMPAWVRMVALSGVCHGAALALVMVQLRSGHDLCLLEPSYLVGANEEEQEELIGDYHRDEGHRGDHACRRRHPRCLL